MNASDERTGDAILNKIKNSISMNSYFDSEEGKKPVCLIVDEVDGAIGGGTDQDNLKGIKKIVDYLKKCINY